MGIAKRPKLATKYLGPRATGRDPVSLEASLTVGDGPALAVGVLDLDALGCRISGFSAAVTKVDPIALRLGAVPAIAARLRWAKNGNAGLRFDTPLTEAELAEAERTAAPSPSRVVPLRRG